MSQLRNRSVVKSLSNYNGRSTAPKDFDPERFQDLPLSERFTGPITTGVPGLIRGWETMLEEYGTMPLSRLLQPAITTAQDGFEVDQSYVDRIDNNLEDFKCFTSTKDQFLTENGQVPKLGKRVHNQELAETYHKIAKEGTDIFYEGEIAQAIVDTVQEPPVASGCKTRPGKMNLADLAAYDAPIHEPVTISYRDYDIAGIGLPATGGPTVGEILQIIEGFDMSESRVQALHYLLEAFRLAYTDRAKYIGSPWEWDPSVPLSEYPVERLMSDQYAAARRKLIDTTARQSLYSPGNPCDYPGTAANPYPPGDACQDQSKNRQKNLIGDDIRRIGTTNEISHLLKAIRRNADHPKKMMNLTANLSNSVDTPELSTTHLSVSDSDGNIVSYTSSIISIGGSAVTVPDHGFLLNNVLIGAVPPAAPGDRGGRPYSNGSPTIVFEDNEPVLTIGSPGSFSIISTVANVLVNYLDLDMDLYDAIAAPRVENTNAKIGSSVESDLLGSSVANGLKKRGHELEKGDIIGEPTGIAFRSNGRIQAVAEPLQPLEGSALVEKEAQKKTGYYQVDFVVGEPIKHLNGSGNTYKNSELIRFLHGSTENQVTRRSDGEFVTDNEIAKKIESQKIAIEKESASITFTVAKNAEPTTLSLVSYTKPGPEWSPEIEHLQGFVDAQTNTFQPGTYTLNVDLPNEVYMPDTKNSS